MADKAVRPHVDVPELDHDRLMLNSYGYHVSANGRIERRIVAALIAHLKKAGVKLVSVFDGDEDSKVSDAKAAMELIFNLDEASLRVRGRSGFGTAQGRVHGILLVLGNGEDIISDWNYAAGDPDGFNAAMEAFKPEDWL